MSNCKSNFNPIENSIWAGHVIKDKSFPARREGFFLAQKVVATSAGVEGYLAFPQCGRFEYKGSMQKLLKALKEAGGAGASLQIPSLTHWMD